MTSRTVVAVRIVPLTPMVAVGATVSRVKGRLTEPVTLPVESVDCSRRVWRPSVRAEPRIVSRRVRLKVKLPLDCTSAVTSTRVVPNPA